MYKFAPGSTSRKLYFELYNSTTGVAEAALTASSPGGVASYTREGGSATSISLTALGSPTASWTAGGFVRVDNSLAPGLYRLDVPDAAFASGVSFVIVSLAFSGVREEAVLVRLETAVSNVGSGSIAFTVTITNSVTGLPVANAECWVSTDSAGTNVVAGTLVTNAFGQCTFQLDPGTFFLWASEPGFTRSNPTTIVVS